jgi:glycogen debranching enzyme
MTKPTRAEAPGNLIEACRLRAVKLLRRNLTPAGILASSRSAAAAKRGYLNIFGRDASLCAIGMAVSGDPVLEEGAVAGLATLAAHQAGNGQIPNIVYPGRAHADFWYVGCIDATLWWLAAVAALDRIRPAGRLRRRFGNACERALDWLRCQEHPGIGLLQQNEASDWADIMPRSGFVLYSNALWHLVKIQYGLPGAPLTRANARRIFNPFGGAAARDRRVALLAAYAKHVARDRGLYLSYVNFADCGDEGDTFANALALLCGLVQGAEARRVRGALERAHAGTPYPMRVVCDPIPFRSRRWRAYMERHRQNFAWQYHNGGIWPFAGALWVAALAEAGERASARRHLLGLAGANALGDWAFYEWLHGRTCEPRGMRGQSWNAAGYLIAHHATSGAAPIFRRSRRA